ncbi:MAG TPA: YbfB/YjiJ family MFS transporter [Bradyrhizobium sp.]
MPATAVAFAGLAALAVAMGIGRFAFTPILPMMQDDAGLSIADGGWLASANYAGYLAGALSAIRLPLSPVAAIRTGLVVISASTLAMGMNHGFAYWLVLRAVAGVASAWVMVFVSAWALGKRAEGGTLYAGVGAGTAAAGTVCLALMAVHASSSEAWMTLGAVSFIMTAFLWRIFDSGPNPESRFAHAEPGSRHWLLILCYGAFGFGYIIPATFLPAMAKEVIADPALFGWAWPVFGAAAAASTFFARFFTNQRNVWIVATLLMALGVLLPVMIPGLSGILIAASLIGGTFMVITMAGMQEARRVAAEHARPLMAAMTSAFALGQIAGPLWVGYKSSVTHTLFAAAAVLVLSAAALFCNRVKT